MARRLIFLVCFVSVSSGLNFFTAEVTTPDAPYTQVLSGNDVFEIVYSTFNNTGLFALGSALLLTTGIKNQYMRTFKKGFF
jgi:hypothetical protein